MEYKGDSNSTFTCISCRVGFKDTELQKLHYKSDWHRYNLKRKVVDLPPITSEDFQKRVLNQRNVIELSSQDQTVYCQPCRKSFNNSNSYNNHLNSKKHIENEKKSHEVDNNRVFKQQASEEKDLAVEEGDSDEWEDESISNISNECIFCPLASTNIFSNIEHMTIRHSFFIPDLQYCTNLNGLLEYLREKVVEGFMCLWCNESGRTFHSAEAARAHMQDKGHCKMIFEGPALSEYVDFYDYSTSYPDAEDVNPDEEVADVPELEGSEFELVLPSGVTVGHRSLLKYYKQRTNPNKALVVKKSEKKLHKTLSTYRALGWSATDQVAAARRAKDIHYLKRVQAKYMTKLGVKNNMLLQKHFRVQVTF